MRTCVVVLVCAGFVALAFLSSSLAADDFYGSYRNGETAEPEAQVAPVSQPAAETAAK